MLRYHATRFIDAIYQRFAEEFAGLIQCARCPAPDCGRWFLKSAGRGDRRFCSHPCKMRAGVRERVARCARWIGPARSSDLPARAPS